MTKSIKTLVLVGFLLVGSKIQAGPIAGAIGYWGTKFLCYGTAVGAGAVVLVSGMAAAPAVAVVAGTGAVVAGASAVVGTATTVAVASTTAGVSAGTVTTVIAGVETASTTVATLLTLCPFLP